MCEQDSINPDNLKLKIANVDKMINDLKLINTDINNRLNNLHRANGVIWDDSGKVWISED